MDLINRKNNKQTNMRFFYLIVVFIIGIMILSVLSVSADFTVDDDGGQDYTTIQAAINAASPGDTIYVYNGTYNENVNIQKTISVIGNSSSECIVKSVTADIAVFTIRNADNINLSGFTARDANGTQTRGILIDNANYSNLTDIVITNITLELDPGQKYVWGLILMNACYTTVDTLDIYDVNGSDEDHRAYGIQVATNSVNNTFSNINIRNISANKTGIGIYTSTENNTYNNVNISELWGNSSSYGVYILNNNNVTVENCKIENVTSNALACGLYLINSNDVSFTEGNIYNISGSDSYGINTDSSPIFNLSNNVINNCDIGVLIEDSDYGFLIDNVIEETNTFGINISISSYNDIFLNKLNHSNYGIYLYASNYNNVSYNNFNDSDSGLYLKSSDKNMILYNVFNNSNDFGFFVWYSDDNQIGYNTILESGYGSFGSCPILYTWDGSDMRLFGDINGPGGLGYRLDKGIYNEGIVNRAPTSTDYTAIDSSYLSPKDGSYVIEIAEDQDEITYLDYAELWVIDHDLDVEIYSPEAALVTCTPYLHPFILHTVRNPFPPVSAVDRNGEDIKSVIAFADEVYTEAELLTDNVITLDLGDLSEAEQIKLVYRAYTDWSPIGKVKAIQYVEVINEFGEWEMVSDDEHFGLPEAMPRTYVIDITGWFKTNDWHVKLHTGEVKVHVDWINIDTSLDEKVDITILNPSSAEHYYKGIQNRNFEYFFGRFTRYGNVLKLLADVDDKYVIMRTGDSVILNFNEQPAALKDRDFLLFTDADFKQPFVKYKLGNKRSTVDPIPFHKMSNYPYKHEENYIFNIEHILYLIFYNTRIFDGNSISAGMSLPYSDNNTVYENLIIGGTGSVGLQLVTETNTKLINNTITNSQDGIWITDSDNITVYGNKLYNHSSRGLYISSSTNSTIKSNRIINNTNYGIYLSNSDNNTIYNNYLNNTVSAWDNTLNKWNITKILGENIFGGAYLGGNYYSNYTGKDTNYDGLGETPYNIPGGGGNIDYKPLTKTRKKSGGGSGGHYTPPNQPPIADASKGEPYDGFVGIPLTFDGSLSSDSDGNITSWQWDFGDNLDGEGEKTTHIYYGEREFNVTLTVIDDDGAEDTYETVATITQPNRPPSKPTIDGPVYGDSNTSYSFIIKSTDPDNDDIKYTIEWGDESSDITEFYGSGVILDIQHLWDTSGVFIIKVSASDGQSTSDTTIKTILINIEELRDFGYLLDTDDDGVFDTFQNETTGEKTAIELIDGDYLIDDDGDGEWDYKYNEVDGLSAFSEDKEETPGLGIFMIIIVISLIGIVVKVRRQKKS